MSALAAVCLFACTGCEPLCSGPLGAYCPEGVSQKLVGVDIDGAPLGSYIDNEMLDFFPVSAGGNEVGRVTSACYSPRLERNIGFAMLPIEHTELGTSLEVQTPKAKVAATVVAMPHWDPTKEIPKG